MDIVGRRELPNSGCPALRAVQHLVRAAPFNSRPVRPTTAKETGQTMAIKPNWKNLTRQQQDELSRCVPTPGWRIIPQAELPSFFPEGFRKKIDSALMISTLTSTGGTYLVYSANRIDLKDRAVDIEPAGLILHSTGASTSAVFLHHGAWEGRSEYPPAQFWDEISRSGVGNYYHTNPPGGLHEGTLDQLPKGHRGAFDELVREIRAYVDGHRK